MNKIFLIGAGLSASTLINYLLDNSEEHNWKLRVGDFSLETAKKKIKGHKNAEAIKFDIYDEMQRDEEIKNADIVISMLPARMHHMVAEYCIKHKKDMVTASYVSKELKAMKEDVEKSGILILNEIGVDPGIDHMSAMQVIDRIKEQGGRITAFRSYTGGLVSPKYDNNPWNYKFTWNPRNVVVAGQGSAAQIIVNGKYKYIPYHRLFQRISRTEVLDYGEFEIYPNRDSLAYRKEYGLEDIKTMIRGTMRRPGFSRAWNVFVQLGATDDTYTLENSENMTYREFTNTFLKFVPDLSVEEKICKVFNIDEDSSIMYRLRWLGIFKDTKIGLKNASPAQILQKILVEKWVFGEQDKDMIVMQHKFQYELNGKTKEITSSLVVEGEDNTNTAMSATVGLPVGIATKMILTGKIKTKGIQIPVIKSIYEPVLEELRNFKIKFEEEDREIINSI
ncbi:MAG: saccharopine dehydrogenase NADP-binding domain-containing protein [Bacteroidales bacterium]|nr:saccharopine dehydrogenase NADP-binding domain-containing protein [Bacteroidales bacterium]